MSEIKLRGIVRIGELVRELDTAHKAGPGDGIVQPPGGRKLKAEAIAEAGLSKSEAYRLQDLAGPRDEQAQAAGKAAAENYFAKARQERDPATMDGLRGAIKEPIHDAWPIPTPKPPPPVHILPVRGKPKTNPS